MYLLVYFAFFLFLTLILHKRIKSVAIFFILIQIVSLTGALIIGRDYPVNTPLEYFNLIFTAFIMTMVISPWSKYRSIRVMYFRNEEKLRNLTRMLLILSAFTFVTLLITAWIVISVIRDINAFRYGAGVSTNFFYNLPINVKLIILSTYLHYFSFFLIPLHFYYLSEKRYGLSLLCFLGSLNSILFGLTFFSRAAFAQYALIYISFLILLYDVLDYKIKKILKRIAVIFGILFIIYFIRITELKFKNDFMYKKTISRESQIKDPIKYSYFDYLSQWYYNGMYVLNSYHGRTFSGQISFQPVLTLAEHYNLINYNSREYSELRKQLWPNHWDKFNGLVAYIVYDFGYIVSVILVLIFNITVQKLKPVENRISILNLFYIVLLIQIPLLSIFYSALPGILIPLLLLLPIHLYLRTTIKFDPELAKERSLLNQ